MALTNLKPVAIEEATQEPELVKNEELSSENSNKENLPASEILEDTSSLIEEQEVPITTETHIVQVPIEEKPIEEKPIVEP